MTLRNMAYSIKSGFLTRFACLIGRQALRNDVSNVTGRHPACPTFGGRKPESNFKLRGYYVYSTIIV